MADVFISYSSGARPLTEELALWLEAQRLSVWYDRELRSGVRYPTEIRRQLIAAKAAVVLWSRPSLHSEWVYAEAVEAARVGTAVFVTADDVAPSQLPLPFNAGFHVVRLEDREAILAGVRNRINGQLEPAKDQALDPRWAGIWLLDPLQRPFRSEDAKTSPASLLLARHALVPFLELGGELTAFLDWATGSRRRVSARVLAGAGGLGKTRLMIEVCARLADEGWLTGFVPDNLIGVGNELSELKLRTLIEDADSPRSLFLAVDYAETRRKEIEWLCKRLLQRRDKGGAPARLVLISRAAGEWWTDLFDDPDVQKLFGRDNGESDIFSLDVLTDSLTREKREALFQSSINAFRPVLEEAGRATPTSQPSADQLERVLDGETNARPLAIQLEAILHLYGEAPDGSRLSIDKLLDRVLGLETTGWARRLKIEGERQRRRRVARGVCQTTLAVRIDHRDQAIELLKRAEQCSDEVADDIHNELHILYGKPGGGLLPLEPDLIGEHHVAQIADDKLVDACLAWAQEDGARRRAILTVLNRSTRQKERPSSSGCSIAKPLSRTCGRSPLAHPACC